MCCYLGNFSGSLKQSPVSRYFPQGSRTGLTDFIFNHQFHRLINYWVLFEHQHCLHNNPPICVENILCSITKMSDAEFLFIQLQLNNISVPVQFILFQVFQFRFPLQFRNWIGIELITSNSVWVDPSPCYPGYWLLHNPSLSAFDSAAMFALLWFFNGFVQGGCWPACAKMLKQVSDLCENYLVTLIT